MAAKVESYRITLSLHELQALAYFYADNPEIATISKYHDAAIKKIQVAAFKASVGAAAPAYVSTGTVVRTKGVGIGDLGFSSEELELAATGGVNKLSPEEELLALEAAEKEMEEFTRQLEVSNSQTQSKGE